MSTEIQKFNPEISFTQDQLTQLKEPLKAERIHYRKGPKGMELKYIKGDDAIGRANDIFGYGKWGYRVVNREHKVVEDRQKGPIDVYMCDIELFVAGALFPFSGDGMAAVNDPYTVEMHDMARHAAETDAVKRALRYYGDQFGLSLYDKDDYVDIGDGVLEKVGNVRKGQKSGQQNGKKTVDEHPEKISDLQKESIQKLCDMLKVAMPEKVDTLAFLEARELIVKLKEKYKEMKVAQKAEAPAQQAEPEPAQMPATDQQKASIQKLCERLQKPDPEVWTFNQAREAIRQLTEELKAKKASEQAATAAQSNGHQAKPEPAQATQGTKMIIEGQMIALINLYEKLGQHPPDNLDKWSFEQASIGIKELNGKLKAAKVS